MVDTAAETPNPLSLGKKLPPEVWDRIRRGEAQQRNLEGMRDVCWSFWRGDQYVSLHQSNFVVPQGTRPGSDKPIHRARLTFNPLIDVVARITSAAMQRVPAYEINPSTMDPQSKSAAILAGKVARYGYDKWRLDRVAESVITHALVADEGFAWPYFDSSIGPEIGNDSQGNKVGIGELKVRVLGSNQVYWEPGVDFYESRWHCVREGRPVDVVEGMPGYLGGKVVPDAVQKGQSAGGRANLVLVTEYLERPSFKHPAGRWITMANGRIILEEQQYPLKDHESEPLDEPVLHELSWIVDPSSERNMGLVRHTLDAVRLKNKTNSKIVEWMDHALMPQMLNPKGSLQTTRTDEPGLKLDYLPINGLKPEWAPVPPIPRELFELSDKADAVIGNIAAQNSIPSGVTAANAINNLLASDAGRQEAFIKRLAKFHARLMRHCLYLVQQHYTEKRLLLVRGKFGPEPIEDFMGAKLCGQMDITVNEGSMQPRSRQAVKDLVIFYAQQGWIKPETAMAAVDAGTAEDIVSDYEADVSWQNHEITLIKNLAKTTGSALDFPEADETPQLQRLMDLFKQSGVPVPRWFDNHKVHMDQIAKWMKTLDYEYSEEVVKQTALLHYQAHEQMQMQKDMQAAQAQQQMAEGLGMANAAVTPSKGMPSQAGAGVASAPGATSEQASQPSM